MKHPSLPPAPHSIAKGSSLAELLNEQAVRQLAANLRWAWPDFPVEAFLSDALPGLAPLALKARAQHIAEKMRVHLPSLYEEAVHVILRSLTPPLRQTDEIGLAPMFYFPHNAFIATYGQDPAGNAQRDPFPLSLSALSEITRRFTAEFGIRPFLQQQPERTLAVLLRWTTDPDPHLRRLCSEGSRPRLPWGGFLPRFIEDPRPLLPLLEALKDDPDLYVRRSVANHLGDWAKDHPDLAFAVAARWLTGASEERRWLIRHALRHPEKQGHPVAIRLRLAAGHRA